MISLSQKNWRKLVKAFGSSMKVPWNQKNNATIQINSQKYRAVVITILTGQALIPWVSCRSIYKKEVNALGMSFTQFFIEVDAHGENLQIVLPSNIGSSILEKGYLKLS
jgi:hypothetical protein